jgi:hypothetical protein
MLIAACNCENPNSKTPPTTTNHAGNKAPQVVDDKSSAGGKTERPSSPKPWDATGNIYKAAAWIDATDAWLKQLGIDKTKKETVVINASNPSIKSPLGGIDGALGNWARANQTTPWTNPIPTLPNGKDAPNTLEAGNFALFPVSFGAIYLAVGPRCSQVQALTKTKDLIANLYYNILMQAKKDKMKCVVLCAISTDIFAGDGKETDTGKQFKKEEFVTNVYEGMQQGIAQFQQATPKHTLKIILNNWAEKEVDEIKRLN